MSEIGTDSNQRARPAGSPGLSIVGGMLLMALGLIVIAGWHAGSALVVQIAPQWVPMQYNTALGLFLVGLALTGLGWGRPLLPAIAGGAVIFLGALTLAQYLLKVNFGIDELLMQHSITVETSHPGRMAPNSALCFILSGVCSLVLASATRLEFRELVGQIFGLMLLTLATTALLGYILGTEAAYGWGALTRMAPHTAAGFTVAAVALISRASGISYRRMSKVPIWWTGALYAAVFLLDTQAPIGLAAGVAYVPLVFCSLWFGRDYVALLFAVLSTALIILGYIASPNSEIPIESGLLNRGLSIGAVWISALTLFMYGRAIGRLSRNKEQLELALEGGRLGLWDWNVPTSRVEYSPRWCRMVGYEPHELSPDFSTWERLLHPEDFPGAQQRALDHLAGKTSEYKSEFRMQHKNGGWRWVQARGNVVETDADGNPVRVAGTHLDITDEKQKEEQLRLLQVAVDHSDSVVLITTPDPHDPRIVYASEMSTTICGYTPEELHGRNLSFLQGPSRDEETLDRLHTALHNQQTFDGDLLNYRKDGTEYRIRLHIFPIRDQESRLLHFGSIGYDVTEEHKAEQALRHEQERFQSVMEYSPIGIALVAPDGSWLHVNPAICRIVGYSEQELLATDFQSITHPEDLELDLGNLHQMLAGGIKTYEMEKRYIHKDGHFVWILLTVSLVWNEDGTPRHFISQIQDISKRKESEEQVRQYLIELERSNRQLDDFAYIASHDLKEPLRAINNHSQSLIKLYSDRLDDKGNHKLERLGKLTERMQQLISDLLYFSRIGRASEARQQIDVSQLVLEQMDTLSNYLKERNAEVILNKPLPAVRGDASRLATVFRNLIINGVKYNDNSQKTVSISAEPYNQSNRANRMVVFHVADNGIGIEPEFFEDIFRMFKRLHGEKVYGEGTGAGLTFVKKIIEQEGGEIWLSSEPGAGTTFHFTVPGEMNEQD